MSAAPPLLSEDVDYEEEPEDSSEDFDGYPSLLAEEEENARFKLHTLIMDHEDIAPKLATILPDELNDKDHWGQNPLHLAVLSRNLEAFEQLLAAGADASKKCQGSPVPHVILAVGAIAENVPFASDALGYLAKLDMEDSSLLASAVDEYGRTPLRLACELALPVGIIQTLLDAIDAFALEDAEIKSELLKASDRLAGYTALHAAAEAPGTSQEVLSELVTRGGADILDARDFQGRTPLHLAALSGQPGKENSGMELLLAAGADPAAVDSQGRTAQDLAQSTAAPDAPARERRGGTLVLQHDACLEHLTCPLEHTDAANVNEHNVPPENVNRLHVLLDAGSGTLRSSRLRDAGAAFAEAPRAELGDVLRVHDWGYLSTLQAKCADLAGDELAELDGDTVVSGMTFEASLYASGAAIAGVDAVLGGGHENAFCAVRPPGHHAGPCGLVPGCTSHGFCMVNNVAVAAAYALNVHRASVQRVAIVDFDVHHGNGTEVCVNHLLPAALQSASFELPMGGSIKVSQPAYKPWLGEKDFENVLFCSVHGFGKAKPGLDPDPLAPPFLPAFYPASGASQGWAAGSVLNYGQNSGSRQEWRQAWRDIVLPRVVAFKPDFILVSAGFDAHAKDAINGGFCGVLETDYVWLTRALVGVANQVCQGRLVSVLEGGYRIEGRNVSAFARSVHDHVLALAEARPDVMWDGLDVEAAKPKLVSSSSATSGTNGAIAGGSDKVMAEGGSDVVGALPETASAEPAADPMTGAGEAGEMDAGNILDKPEEEPSRRPTRRRPLVDYVKLSEELDRDKRMKREGANAGNAGAP